MIPKALEELRSVVRSLDRGGTCGIREFGVHPEILYFYANDATYRHVNQPREIE
jgi:hypothetical protein